MDRAALKPPLTLDALSPSLAMIRGGRFFMRIWPPGLRVKQSA